MDSVISNLCNVMAGEPSLLNGILNKVNQSYRDELKEKISPLPDYVLSHLSTIDSSDCNTCNEFLDKARVAGKLQFTPIVTHSTKGVPALVVDAGRFIVPIENKTFKIVSSLNTMTEYDDASYNCAFLFNEYFKYMQTTLIWRVLYMSCAYSLAAEFENFNNAIHHNSSFFTHFIQECMKYTGFIDNNFKFSTLEITYMDSAEDLDELDIPLDDNFKFFNICSTKTNTVVANLIVTGYYVAARTKEQCVVLSIDGLYGGSYGQEFEQFISRNHGEVLSYLKENNYLQMLSVFVLNYLGVTLNWLDAKGSGSVEPIENKDNKDVRSLMDLRF